MPPRFDNRIYNFAGNKKVDHLCLRICQVLAKIAKSGKILCLEETVIIHEFLTTDNAWKWWLKNETGSIYAAQHPLN